MKTTSLLFTIVICFFLSNSCSSNTEVDKEEGKGPFDGAAESRDANWDGESFTGTEIPLEDLAEDLRYESEGKITLGTNPTSPSAQIPDSRDDLDEMRTVIQMHKGSTNAGITVPGFGGIKLGKEESSLSLYYVETKVVTKEDKSIVYGCGYSIHYLFKKIKKGIEVTNLPSIAASAQLENGKTQVLYSLQTYGIKGTNLIGYFKPNINQDFDVKGFGIIQSSIDGIHNVLEDTVLSKSVKFTPTVIKFITPADLQ